MQEALMRSYVEQRSCDEDQDLQEAIMQSRLGGSGRPPEEQTECVLRLEVLMSDLGLQRMDVGSTNLSEGGNMLSNQCLYLAIARSWLADAAKESGLLVRDSALQLKRDIESSVLHVRGEGGRRDVGEEAEAYTDFLACALCGEVTATSSRSSATGDLAIIVFASALGALEAYVGHAYARQPRHERVANLCLVWHRIGHFEAVVAAGTGGKADVTLEELLTHAEHMGVHATVVRG